MSIFKSGIARNGLVFSLALTSSVAVHANTVNVVFAAENALYGAGYDIGRADGWIDDTLRQAIRKYQSQNPDITASGNLDSVTLAALGVANEAVDVVSGNDVAKRADALAALGITEIGPQSKPTDPPPRKKQVAETFTVPTTPELSEPVEVAANPEPLPEPEPESEPESAQLPNDIKPEPALAEATPEPSSEPQKITEDKPVTSHSKTEKNIKKAVPEIEPEVANKAEPEVLTAEATNSDSSVQEHAGQTKESPDLAMQLPEEPTASGNPNAPAPEAIKTEAADTAVPDHSENEGHRTFLGTLFDFLFGWMA